MKLNNAQIVLLTFLKTFGASAIDYRTKAGATLSRLIDLGLAEEKRVWVRPTRRVRVTEKGKQELRQHK